MERKIRAGVVGSVAGFGREFTERKKGIVAGQGRDLREDKAPARYTG
jgi:hypothetical protein